MKKLSIRRKLSIINEIKCEKDKSYVFAANSIAMMNELQGLIEKNKSSGIDKKIADWQAEFPSVSEQEIAQFISKK